MSKPSKLQIVANFDVAQVSPMLECLFNRTDLEGNPILGKNAGSVAFAQGEEVTVQINAGGVQLLGAPRPFAAFNVVDCSLTCRPRVYSCGPNQKKVVYAPPSMFKLVEVIGQDPVDVKGATVVLPAAHFKKVTVADTPPGYFQEGMLWNGKLLVGQAKARWRLTLLVTVAVDYGDGSEPEMRVYEVDPETEVTSGGGGKPPMEELRESPIAMATCEVDPETEVTSGGGGKP